MGEENESPSAADPSRPRLSLQYRTRSTTVGEPRVLFPQIGLYLEHFADAHTPCPGVLTSGKVGTHIHAIYLTELESYTPTAAGKEVIGPEGLASAGHYFANAAKPDKSESLGERQTVF